VNLKKFATVTKFRLRQSDGAMIMVMGSVINNIGEELRSTLHGVDDYLHRCRFSHLALTRLLSGAEMPPTRSR
jgi:hypothetical protein